MECIEARALKSSFLSEIDMKSTQQVFIDDLWCVTGINSVSGDDFSVDELLDFSGEDFKDGSLEESEEEKDFLSVSSQNDDNNSNSTTFSGTDNFGSFGSLPTGGLAVPVDDLENLEWLSQFVDDSVSEFSLLCPTGSFKEKTSKFSEHRCEPEARKTSFLWLSSPVPAKPRSKRSRPNGRVWSLGSPSLTESSSSSSRWSSSTSSSVFSSPVQLVESLCTVTSPPKKKQKKKPASENGSGSQTQRRCSHCQVQKTPQWRSGPLGAKTLCNACGVRYKSGRLLPEYRPACSPTFSGDVHSNSHRKVLEMRWKKEMDGPLESGLTSIFLSV